MEEGGEARRGFGEVTEEGSGNEEEVEDEEGGDAAVGGDVSCGSGGAFVEMEEDFGCGTEIEAIGEALGREGVVEEGGELEVKAEGEEDGEEDVEEIGPEEGRETAEGDA